jgi:hypothetical protein
MKEAPGSSETSVLTRATRRNNPEDTILHSHRRENLKSYCYVLLPNVSPNAKLTTCKRAFPPNSKNLFRKCISALLCGNCYFLFYSLSIPSFTVSSHVRSFVSLKRFSIAQLDKDLSAATAVFILLWGTPPCRQVRNYGAWTRVKNIMFCTKSYKHNFNLNIY